MEQENKFWGEITLEKREKVSSKGTKTIYCIVQDEKGYRETIHFDSLEELRNLHSRIGAFIQTQNC